MAFTFNNIESSTYLKTTKIKYSILPPLNPRLVNAPKRAGSYDFGVDIAAKEFEIDVMIVSKTENELRLKIREIAEWLFQEDLCPLVFDDEPDKTYYARINGDTVIDELLTYGQGTLVFLCPEPFAYGDIKTATVEKGSPEPPAFNRDSQAYDEDGNYYSVDKPRYVDGFLSGSKAILVEEETTNLIPDSKNPVTKEISVTKDDDYTLSTYPSGSSAEIKHKFTDSSGLALSPITPPTLTRNSGAISSDGGYSVGTGNPRFSNSRYGKGIHIEEGTTNLVSDGSFNADTNGNGFADPWYSTGNPTKPTFSFSTTEKYFGGQSQKVVVPSTGGSLYQPIAITAGQKYSFSVYCKITAMDAGGNFTFLIEWYDASDVLLATGGTVTFSTETAATNAWKRYKGEGVTAPTGAAKVRIIMKMSAGGTFYADGAQVENKAYCTTFMDTTRSSELLTMPAPADGSIIGGDSGTVELVFRRTGKPSAWANLFAWGAWSDPVTTDNIVIAHNTGMGLTKIYAELRSKLSATAKTLTVTLPSETQEMKDYYVGLRWNFDGVNGYLKLDVYDFEAGTWYSNSLTGLTEAPLSFDLYDKASIGSDIDNVYPANMIVSTFSATNFARPDSHIYDTIPSTPSDSLYAFPMDKDTTYRLNFNSILTPSVYGEKISDLVSSFGGLVTTSNELTWNETTASLATSAVYTSIDGGTTWDVATKNAPIPNFIDGDQTGKNLKVKLVLQANGTSLPSFQDISATFSQGSIIDVHSFKAVSDKIILIPSSVLWWQLENRPYKTTYIDGTRSVETIVIDGAEAIFTNLNQSTGEGTIEIRAYEDGIGRLGFIFDTWDGNDYYSTNYDRMLIQKVTSGNYVVYINNTYLGTVPNAGVGWHVFALRWLYDTVEFFIDGVLKATYTLSGNISTDEIKELYLGTRYAPTSGNYNVWNNGIDEMRISSKKRTDLELQSSVNAKMVADSDTIYKVEFDGDLTTVVEQVPHDVLNTGTAKTYPIMTCVLKQNTSYIRLDVGDAFILINHDFKVNDTLTIDMERALVTVNGMRIMNKVDLSSHFFPLQKGTNTFVIEPANVADINVQFREKWL